MDVFIGVVLLIIIVVVVLSKIPPKPTFVVEGKIIEKKYGFEGHDDSYVTIKTKDAEIIILRFETHDTSSCYHSGGTTCFHGTPGVLSVQLFQAEKICVRTFCNDVPERKVHSIVTIKCFNH